MYLYAKYFCLEVNHDFHKIHLLKYHHTWCCHRDRPLRERRLQRRISFSFCLSQCLSEYSWPAQAEKRSRVSRLTYYIDIGFIPTHQTLPTSWYWEMLAWWSWRMMTSHSLRVRVWGCWDGLQVILRGSRDVTAPATDPETSSELDGVKEKKVNSSVIYVVKWGQLSRDANSRIIEIYHKP